METRQRLDPELKSNGNTITRASRLGVCWPRSSILVREVVGNYCIRRPRHHSHIAPAMRRPLAPILWPWSSASCAPVQNTYGELEELLNRKISNSTARRNELHVEPYLSGVQVLAFNEIEYDLRGLTVQATFISGDMCTFHAYFPTFI
jgi:hypothetical protein